MNFTLSYFIYELNGQLMAQRFFSFVCVLIGVHQTFLIIEIAPMI